jgi:DNA (cytosine-5)-methyltransferase 1
VFVVGHPGDWRRAAAVLFERESLQGNIAPRRQAGQGTAATVAPSLVSGVTGALNSAGGHAYPGQANQDFNQGFLIPSTSDVSHRLNAGGMGRQDYETETLVAHALRADGFVASEDGTGRGTPLVPIAYSAMPMNSGKDFVVRETDVAQPIMAAGPSLGNQGGDYIAQAVVHCVDMGGNKGMNGGGLSEGFAPPLNTNEPHVIANSWAVRRLTPRECERLQGFPDDYTQVPHRGKPAADGPRYKALGNSMAVNCMRWIGRRIEMVESIT